MVVIDCYVVDVGGCQGWDDGGFLDVFGELGVGWLDVGLCCEFVVQCLYLFDVVVMWNGGEYWFCIVGIEQFDLVVFDYLGEQCYVGWIVLVQLVEQLVGKMCGEVEVGIGVQGFQERFVVV